MTNACRVSPLNYVDIGTVTATSSETGWSVTNLQSTVREYCWRSTSTSTQTITGTFGGRRLAANCWGAWPGDYSTMYGSEIQVRLFDGTDLVYDSGNLDFFSTGLMGTGPFGGVLWADSIPDIQGFRSRFPVGRHFETVTADSYEMIFNPATFVPSFFELRRIWVGESVALTANAKAQGLMPGFRSNSANDRSLGGSARRLVRARWKGMRLEAMLESQDELNTWNNLSYFCDPGREVWVSLFQDAGKLQEIYSVLGSMKVLPAPTGVDYGINSVSVEIEES